MQNNSTENSITSKRPKNMESNIKLTNNTISCVMAEKFAIMKQASNSTQTDDVGSSPMII